MNEGARVIPLLEVDAIDVELTIKITRTGQTSAQFQDLIARTQRMAAELELLGCRVYGNFTNLELGVYPEREAAPDAG